MRFVGSDEWVPSRRVPTVLGVDQWPVAVGPLLLLSKTNQLGGRPVRRVMGSDGVLQSRLVKAFVVLSAYGVHPADETPFFSRPQHCALVSARTSGLSTEGTVRKKRLASSVTAVAKVATAAVGLDPRRISAVSLNFKNSVRHSEFPIWYDGCRIRSSDRTQHRNCQQALSCGVTRSVWWCVDCVGHGAWSVLHP